MSPVTTLADVAPSPALARFVSRLDGAAEAAPTDIRTVAVRAPFRLDVMGGFSDSAGVSILSWLLNDGVEVACRPRSDQQVCVRCLTSDAGDGRASSTWPLAMFYGADGDVRAALPEDRPPADAACERAVAAVMLVMLRAGRVSHFAGGVSVFVSGLPGGPGALEASVSVQAATTWALSRLMDAPLEVADVALICQQAQREWPGLATGPSGPLAVVSGQAAALLQARGDALTALRLPAGVALVAIASGARHPRALHKCREAHLTTRMGCRFVREALSSAAVAWDGQLGRLSLSDYLGRLRERIPTRIKGRGFLERFGPVEDALSAVEPNAMYKVRSRTEHHIYENARTHQFVERLTRAARSSERDALLEAGALMYASHWSFGQRCGLASIETDRLVNLLRRRGPSEGIFGARISGVGAGGPVTVLMADTAVARRAIDDVRTAYEAATGLRAALLDGTSDGLLTAGTYDG